LFSRLNHGSLALRPAAWLALLSELTRLHPANKDVYFRASDGLVTRPIAGCHYSAKATTGSHLWAETYERWFNAEAIFELEDDLVPRIVSTVADMNGALPRSISQAVQSLDPQQLTPYEAVLRSFCYLERATPEELAAARSGLEAVVRKAPGYADAWAMLSFLCCQDYVHGFDLQANALEIATSAARRAVDLGQSNHLAYFSLAQAQFFQKEVQSFRNTAERAVALNSMDGNTLAFMGEMMVYAGDQERGMEWARRAKQLNPSHPGWYLVRRFLQRLPSGRRRWRAELCAERSLAWSLRHARRGCGSSRSARR
jgi:hypothetical protein